MSAQIYADIRAAISAYYPEHLEAFKQCANRAQIINFLDEKLPLPEDHSWENELLVRTPDILKARKFAEDSLS